MKLLIIGLPNAGSRYGKAGLFLPLGLAYITAQLRDRGYQYDTIDLHTEEILATGDLDHWAAINRFDLSSYDVVAFGGVFLKFKDLVALSKRLRDDHPGIFQIVGGNMVTTAPEATLSMSEVDCVCMYEGEEIIVDLVGILQSGGDWREVGGIKFRDDDGNVCQSSTRPKMDSERIPAIPDRENWNFDLIRKAFPVGSPGCYSAVVIASRGCPFKCTFCNPMSGKQIRTREFDNLITEIRDLKENWNVKFIRFFDEVFIGSKKKIHALCDQLIDEKLDIYWWCQTQVRLVDEELLSKMRRAGCIGIGFGIESGSDRILEEMKKGITKDIARNAIETANRVGIQVGISMIAGTPSETAETLRETSEFVRSMNHISWTVIPEIGFIVPLPNTDLYHTAVEMDLIEDPDAYLLDFIADLSRHYGSINMTEMSSGEFQKAIDESNREIREDFYRKHRVRYALSLVGLDHLRWSLVFDSFGLRRIIPLTEALCWVTIGKRFRTQRLIKWLKRHDPFGSNRKLPTSRTSVLVGPGGPGGHALDGVPHHPAN